MNFQLFGGLLAIPDPFYAPMRTDIVAKCSGATLLPAILPAVRFVNTSSPHQSGGGIHCATMTFITPVGDDIP